MQTSLWCSWAVLFFQVWAELDMAGILALVNYHLPTGVNSGPGFAFLVPEFPVWLGATFT